MDDHDNRHGSSSHEAADAVKDDDAITEKTTKARVEAVWEQMNPKPKPKPKPLKNNNITISSSSFNKATATSMNAQNKKKSASSCSSSWMKTLGLNKRIASTDESTKQMAADAIAALTSTSTNSSAAAAAAGKIQITQIKDFAGQAIEVHKVVDADSKEASANNSNGPPSAVDAILEQIKKKQKLSVLDKTKKDWGEYKGDNKGVEDELDAYKKSSNQYLEKVSFLERADYREFERERDVRLALQSKKRSD